VEYAVKLSQLLRQVPTWLSQLVGGFTQEGYSGWLLESCFWRPGFYFWELRRLRSGFVLVFGVASVGAVIGMFKGLPYQPNPGWHTGGDPDLVATATRGAKPVNMQMLEVDRELESREKEEKSD